MKILIEGGNKRQHKAIEEMLPWAMKKLLPRQYSKINLEITIKHLDDCSAGTEPHCDYLKAKRPKHYDIEIDNKLSMRQFRLTLMHEVVHVAQYAKNHLEDYSDGTTRYKDIFYYPEDEIGNNKSKAYWQSPFEEEARGKEEGLLNLWIIWKKEKNNKKPK